MKDFPKLFYFILRYRELCGLGRAHNFNDLLNQIDQAFALF